MNQHENIGVLQIYDKIGMKGSPIHGGTRVLISWWPEFRDTPYKMYFCVIRGRSEGSELLEKSGIFADYLDRNKFDARIILDLVQIVRRDNVKILHCHGYGASNFGRIAGLICKIPVVIHEHMIDKRVPIYQKIADIVLAKLTAKGIAVSNSVKDFMVTKRYLRIEDTHVIYNGIPSNYFRSYNHDEKKNIAKAHSIPNDGQLIGIVGRLNPIKRHEDFIDAARIVLQQYPDTCFLVVGEGDLYNDLLSMAQRLGISKSVIFLGHCENVLEIISLLDVLVLCSHSEGCPVSILEGMASGKAIVATAVGGIPELLSDGKTGLLVPAYSPNLLAQAITKILNDSELKEDLEKYAKLVCKEKFVVSQTVKEISKIYSEIT